MMSFVPIIPLQTIVFPTEVINVKIYKKADLELINHCIEQKKNFGILSFDRNAAFQPYGTLATVKELVKTLKDGTLYVRIEGLSVLRVLEIKEDIPDKKYKGAIIEHLKQIDLEIKDETRELIINEVKGLYELLQVEDKFPQKIGKWISFTLGHKIGLTPAQEYELLTIPSDIQRMEFIRRHLKRMRPVVKELEEMKRRIKMNGHFRNLS